MKSLVASLILGFATLQTVSFVDCCCGSFCGTPGEVCKDHIHDSHQKPCTSCEDASGGCAKKSEKSSPADQGGKTKRCTHVVPLSDLSQVQADQMDHPPQVETTIFDPPSLISNAEPLLILREGVPRAGPGCPRYLRYSALLI